MELQRLKDIALETGFDAAGVAPVALLSEEIARLRKWVEEGKNAGMEYMARNTDKRENPALLVEKAKSVIVTLTNYYTSYRQPEGIPRIAQYAWGTDYHLVIRERLRKVLQRLNQENGGQISGRCFVDSAPVMEHEWARRAGLGWQGRNTLLIHRGLGSFCFIGVIISNAEFTCYDEPFTASFCGNCNRCVDACPTGALKPFGVDARQCISYQTIENKGEYPQDLKKLADGRIFGCDACQEVCPWNAHLTGHRVDAFGPEIERLNLTKDDWESMSPERFGQLFKDSALERTGLEKIIGNF